MAENRLKLVANLNLQGEELVNGTNVIEAYRSGSSYASGDQVVFLDSDGSKLFIANKAISNAPVTFNTDDWDEAGSGGVTVTTIENEIRDEVAQFGSILTDMPFVVANITPDFDYNLIIGRNHNLTGDTEFTLFTPTVDLATITINRTGPQSTTFQISSGNLLSLTNAGTDVVNLRLRPTDTPLDAGYSVSSLPNGGTGSNTGALQDGDGIADFTYDGSSNQTVSVDNSVVRTNAATRPISGIDGGEYNATTDVLTVGSPGYDIPFVAAFDEDGDIFDIRLSLFDSNHDLLFWSNIPPGTPWRVGDRGFARSTDNAATSLFEFQVNTFDHINGGQMNFTWIKTIRDLSGDLHQRWDIDNRGFDIGPAYEIFDLGSNPINLTESSETNFDFRVRAGNWAPGDRGTFVSQDRTSAAVFVVSEDNIAVRAQNAFPETTFTREHTILSSGSAHQIWHLVPGIQIGAGGGERASVVIVTTDQDPAAATQSIPAGSIAIVSAVNQYYNDANAAQDVGPFADATAAVTFFDAESTFSRVGDGDTVFTAADARDALAISDDGTTLTYTDASDTVQTFTPSGGSTFRYDVSTGDTLAFEEQTEITTTDRLLDVILAQQSVTNDRSILIEDPGVSVLGATFIQSTITFTVVSTSLSGANNLLLNLDPETGLVTGIANGATLPLVLPEPTERELIGTVSNVIDVAATNFSREGSTSFFTVTGLDADVRTDFLAAGINGPNRLIIAPVNKNLRFVGQIAEPHPDGGIRFALYTRHDDAGQTTAFATIEATTDVIEIVGTPALVVGTDSIILSELVDVRDASVVTDVRLTTAVINDAFVPNSITVGDTLNLQPWDAVSNANQNVAAYDIVTGQTMRLIRREEGFELRGEVTASGDEFAFRVDSIHNLSAVVDPNSSAFSLYDFIPESYFATDSGTDNTPNNIGAAQTSEAFNVSYTIPQLTSIGLTYNPLTLDSDTLPFDIQTSIPTGQAFVLTQDTNTIADSSEGGAILNSYLTEAVTISTANQTLITAGTNGAGALLEFIVDGEVAGLFFTHDDTNNQWVMNNGFAPAPNGINILEGTDYRLRYFLEAVPPFNNSGRVPFEGSDVELDAILLGYNGVASPVDGTRYLPLVANAELTSAYVDTNEVAVTTVVESITKRRDAFGPFLDLELNQSYRDQNGNRSNIYEPLIDTNARSISLQLVSKVLNSDLYTEGNAAGTINIDGKEVRVPGTLDGSERFETDLAGDVSFVQHNPLTGFNDGFRITYTDNTTNSGTKSSVVEIPGIQSNRDRIQALEGGGDAHSHTSEAFGSFPYPGSVSGTFADGNLVGNADGFNFNTVNPVWSDLMTVTDAAQAHINAGRTFSTGTASQTLAMPLSLRFIIGASTKVQGGSFPWLGTSIRPGEFNLRAGQNLITGDTSDPARELFLALENSFLWGYTADTATYRNSLSFGAGRNVNAGAPGLTFGVTPTQRNPLTQFIGNGEYRQDVVVSFVGFNGVEEEFNLGLTRVVHYTGPILAQDNSTTVNIPDTGAGASTRGEYLSHQAAASHYVITNGTVPKGINLGRLDAQMFWLYPIIQDPATRSSSQFTRRVVNYSGGAQTVGIENRYGNPNNPDIGNELRFYLPDDELNEIYGQDGRLTQTFQFPGIARTDIQSGISSGVNGFARDITLDFQSIDPTDSTVILSPVIGNNDWQFSDGGSSLQSRLTGSGITITYTGPADPLDNLFGRQFRVQVQTFDTAIPNFQFVARYNNAAQRSGWIGINQNNPDSVLSVAYTPRFFVDGSANAMGETRISNLLRRDDNASTFIFDQAGDLVPIADYPTEAEYALSQVTVGRIDYGSGRENTYIDLRLPTVGDQRFEPGTNIGPQLGTSSVITELWQANLGSNVNLHTLGGERDTTTYPLSVQASWFYNQRVQQPDGMGGMEDSLVLTTPDDGNVLTYNDPGILSFSPASTDTIDLHNQDSDGNFDITFADGPSVSGSPGLLNFSSNLQFNPNSSVLSIGDGTSGSINVSGTGTSTTINSGAFTLTGPGGTTTITAGDTIGGTGRNLAVEGTAVGGTGAVNFNDNQTPSTDHRAVTFISNSNNTIQAEVDVSGLGGVISNADRTLLDSISPVIYATSNVTHPYAVGTYNCSYELRETVASARIVIDGVSIDPADTITGLNLLTGGQRNITFTLDAQDIGQLELDGDENRPLHLEVTATTANGGGTSTMPLTAIGQSAALTDIQGIPTIDGQGNAVQDNQIIKWDNTNNRWAFEADNATGGGAVSTSGTPVANQLAVFTDADTIEGDSGLTYSGGQLALGGSGNSQIFITPGSGANETARLDVENNSSGAGFTVIANNNGDLDIELLGIPTTQPVSQPNRVWNNNGTLQIGTGTPAQADRTVTIASLLLTSSPFIKLTEVIVPGGRDTYTGSLAGEPDTTVYYFDGTAWFDAPTDGNMLATF